MSRRTLRNIYLLAIFTMAGSAIGFGYSVSIGGQPRIGATIGCLMVGSIICFELFYVQHSAGNWLRRLPLMAGLLFSTLVWMLIIVASLQLIPRLFGLDAAYGGEYVASTFRQDILFSFVTAFVLNMIVRVRSLVGGRVLSNFLIGRYHRPVREDRVFLFLDLADSTSLSESLGDIKVQSLIGRFFFDIAQPIAEHAGETHRYIGDEVVVTWPMSDAVKDTRCLQCVFDIQQLINSKSNWYQSQFGMVPQFRAGMHGGSVVASEVGDDKREIVYFGDTVNTAARIQSLCKEKAVDFLVSAELLNKLKLPPGAKVNPMGEVTLRGRSKPLQITELNAEPGVSVNLSTPERELAIFQKNG